MFTDHRYHMWYKTSLQEQHTTLPALQKTRTTMQDRHYQVVFPKHTSKYSFKFRILILNRGDPDNKTGCSYTEVEGKTHPCKKNLRYLHKGNHVHVFRLRLRLPSRKQLSTGHKSLHIYNFSKEQKIQRSFLHLQTTTSQWSLQVLDKQGSCDYKRKN